MAPPSAPLPAAPPASPSPARPAEPWELSSQPQKGSGGYREWLQARGTQAIQRSIKAQAQGGSPGGSPAPLSPPAASASPMGAGMLSALPPVPPLPQPGSQAQPGSMQACTPAQMPMVHMPGPAAMLQTSAVPLQNLVSWAMQAQQSQQLQQAQQAAQLQQAQQAQQAQQVQQVQQAQQAQVLQAQRAQQLQQLQQSQQSAWYIQHAADSQQMMQQHYQQPMQPMMSGSSPTMISHAVPDFNFGLDGLCHHGPSMQDCGGSSPTTPASFASANAPWIDYGNQSPLGLSTMIQSFCQNQGMVHDSCQPAHPQQLMTQSQPRANVTGSWSHEEMMAALIPGGSCMDKEVLAQHLRAAAPSCYDD